MLVIWRRPDGDVTEAVAGATFAPGDKVICVEWFGDDPMPAPKWHRNLRPTFDEVEEDYVTRSIDRIVEAQCPKGFAPPLRHSDLGKLTDGELLHMLFGVECCQRAWQAQHFTGGAEKCWSGAFPVAW
jgi:hypothetical protein